MDHFFYLQFSVTPWKARIPDKHTSIVQRLTSLLSRNARMTQYQEIEIGGWKIEFDLTNDWIEREISYDVNWQPIGRFVMNGANEEDWNDLASYALNPTLITQAEFEEEWKKLDP